jgi:molecular chaperone DnaK
MAEILGIDLGTTKSVGAVWRDGAPHIIPDAEGQPIITPSVVAIDPTTGKRVVGSAARAVAERDPRSAIYSIKRFMGRRFGEDVVQKDLEEYRILYQVDESDEHRDSIEVTLGQQHLTPQEVSALILQKIKEDAETYLGHKVSEAVITVPAYFHDSQRQATRDAGRLALLDVKRVLNEPTAACLAFGYQKLNEERKTVAVYDLGGGTFDISILEVGQGPFTVRATNGDTHLGGTDLDWLVVEWVVEQIGGAEKDRLRGDVPALARLRAAAERAKIDLSTAEKTDLAIPGQLSPSSGIHDLQLELTLEQLEEIAKPFIEDTLVPCARALHDARLNTSNVREVLMVGGQSAMPAIRRAVQEFFGIEPNVSVNPVEVVALGAAVQAAIMAGEATGLKLKNVVPLSLGVDTGGQMDTLIERNTPVPVTKERDYSTIRDNQESVEIAVYQGERPLVADNVKLATITLSGIAPAERGVPEIRVKFDVDQDGILHVSGTDLHSGNRKEKTITDSVRLSDEEIAAMIRTAAQELARQLDLALQDEETLLPDALLAAVKQARDVTQPGDWSAHLARLQELWRQVQGTAQGQELHRKASV